MYSVLHTIPLTLSCLLTFSCGNSQSNNPEEPKVVVTETYEKLPDLIFVDGAILPDDAGKTLDAIVSTLETHADIKKLEINASAPTEELGRHRGEVVIQALIDRGIPADRFGNQPQISDTGSVEFVIVR